ncbi:hypothetical protein Q1695_005096 [Nippostrongylus brasiliensis]|nr:hypothetical protein Q1695_005096 [Nippostrongylus brasiliensis]
MPRRKSEPARGITVEEAATRERPEWNDTLRGILCALVKNRRPLWDVRFWTTKDRAIQLFREIAAILSNQDSRMNEWYVLEKWCWMMEMYSRAVERITFKWRFRGAMEFHVESALNGAQYLESFSQEILQELTARYAETPEEAIEAKNSDAPRESPSGKRVRRKRPLTSARADENKLESPESDSQPLQGNGALFETPVSVKQEVPEDLSCPASSGDSKWSSELTCALIRNVKEVPALWHQGHQQFNDASTRIQHLSKIAKQLHNVPGGGDLNESAIWEKWVRLSDRFDEEHEKAKKSGGSDWEFFQNMSFLSPDVMSACRLTTARPAEEPPATVTNLSSADIETQMKKIFGYLPGTVVYQQTEESRAKRPKLIDDSVSGATTKKSVKQVVSTWVPPREEAVGATHQSLSSSEAAESVLQSLSPTPPTATAQVTAKEEIATILQNTPPPRLNLMSVPRFIDEQSFRPHMDKWTLMGRMIEETAREMEAKNTELAFRLQKEINDVIFKYQLESIRKK